MRTLLASAALLLGLAAPSPAAPNLSDKPPKWEYAELTYRTTPPAARFGLMCSAGRRTSAMG